MNGDIKRRGFTLVELLIVIVVIGILSAMMMLSSTEAVSSARAADIISDLRNLKTAALAFYMDNLDEITAVDNENIFAQGEAEYDSYVARVFQYLNNDDKIRLKNAKADNEKEYKYSFGSSDDGKGSWFVWCRVKDDKVRQKLESRATLVGLHGADQYYHGRDGIEYPFKASETNKHKYVGLKIK